MPRVSLALQGGGSHGAFTWGVLDRLLEAAEAGALDVAAISGSSAGALNATVTVAGLVEGGPELARRRLSEFWRLVAAKGALAGNALFYPDFGPFLNIDWSPGAIALEALGLVFSPYDNPFYVDTLRPVIERALPPDRLARLNEAASPRLFVTAVNVATDFRRTWTQGEITVDTLRASSCLPAEFRAVQIGDDYFWDGGYLANPALEPLLDAADDLLLVLVNPLDRTDVPPRNARAILDRLNEITFNASVILEMNGIEAVNAMLEDLRANGIEYQGRYRPINLHVIRNDAFTAQLGVVSKSSLSWPLLQRLHDAGYRTADAFLREHGDSIGQRSSTDVRNTLTRPMLKGR